MVFWALIDAGLSERVLDELDREAKSLGAPRSAAFETIQAIRAKGSGAKVTQ